MITNKPKVKIRVLVVDDSVFFRTTLVRTLGEMPNIEIVGEASDAFEARDKITELKPDVLVMDVVMPNMDGLTFLSELMEQYPMPCIMISGSGDESSAIQAGAADFMKKPRSPSEFKTFSTILGTKIILTANKPVRKASPSARNPSGEKIDGVVPLSSAAKSGKVEPNMPSASDIS